MELVLLLSAVLCISLVIATRSGADRKRYLPPRYNTTFKTSECETKGRGLCKDDSDKCDGSYVSGLCSGPTNVRCCTFKFEIHDTKECQGVKIISRDSWGARRPREVTRLKTPVSDFFIHHTDGNSCKDYPSCIRTMKGIQNFHMDNPDHRWSDIGYSFLVGEDGNIYEGRGFDAVGAHTKGYNSKSLAASVMGNYTAHIPNGEAIKALQTLINCSEKKNKISKDYALFGHRDVGKTDCPGTAFYKSLSSWPHWHLHKP